MSPEISGATRLAGVIGLPVRHSLSPAIHNAAFAAAGLDWVYTAFEVAEGRAGEALAAMKALGISGLNVTMPHKTAAADACDTLSAAAAKLRSVNTLVPLISASGAVSLHGESTDGDGFIDALRDDLGATPAGMACVVLGAGGAGRAVALALAQHGAARVSIVNRNGASAVAAASLVGPTGCAVSGLAAETAAAEADLVVNATSLGMQGGSSGLPIDPRLLRPGQLVADLVYSPLETAWLRAAATGGATTMGGLSMLIHQAARSFSLWTGIDAPIDAMRAGVLRALAARS